MPAKKPRKNGKKTSLKKLLRRRVAIHEAGHVVAAWFDPHLPKVLKVTIRPGKDYLGFAKIKFKDVHWSLATEATGKALIRLSLGGMLAERVCLPEHARGVYGDLEWATMFAYVMAGYFGQSKEFGPFAFMTISPFHLSEATKARADAHAEKTLRACEKEVAAGFRKRKQQILAVTHALLKKKTLRTKQLKKLLGPRPERIK
jgi:cell division protease FtsH